MTFAGEDTDQLWSNSPLSVSLWLYQDPVSTDECPAGLWEGERLLLGADHGSCEYEQLSGRSFQQSKRYAEIHMYFLVNQ